MRFGVNYSIRIKGSAAREPARIPQPTRQLLIDAIESLRRQPRQGRPLRGNLRGLRRLRVGSYRIVHQLRQDGLTVLVVFIKRRLY